MKKILILMFVLLVQTCCYAKDSIEFTFPDSGWHKIESPDNVQSKKCYVPANQDKNSFTEIIVFVEKATRNTDFSPITVLHKQLGKDRLNYADIEPHYIKQDLDDAMITWCSQTKNTCAIRRAFRGKEGVIVASYENKMPHYSQNMFAKWSNILGSIKTYNEADAVGEKIEL